jgi:hypothetical protein
MKDFKYFLLLVAALSLITIPILLLIIPYPPLMDISFSFLLLYLGTAIFTILVYILMRNKFNLLLLPLSFVMLLIIHYVVGVFVVFVGFYSNPHPEWMWYYVGFFFVYIVPFLIITSVISSVIEIIKYKIKHKRK